MRVAFAHPHQDRRPGLFSPGHGVWTVLLLILAVTGARLVFLTNAVFPLQPSEALLWLAGRTPGLDALGGEPLVPLLLGVLTTLFGDSELVLRVPGVLADALAALLVWRLALLMHDARTAFWAMALFLTLPVISHLSAVSATASFLPLFWAAALIALLRGLRTGRLSWWLVLGLVFGLGLLTDQTMALFVPCFLVYVLLSTEYHALWRRGGLWIALLLGLFLAAPGLWLQGTDLAAAALRPTPDLGGAFLVAQVVLFGPIPVLVLLWVAFHPSGSGTSSPLDPRGVAPSEGRRTADERARMGYRTRFFLSFSLPVLVLGAFGAASGLDLAPPRAAMAYVGGSILVAAWLVATGPRMLLLRLAIVLHIVGAFLYFNMDGAIRATGLRPPEGLDPFAGARGLDAIGHWGAELAQRYPDARLVFDDRNMGAILSFYIHPHPMESLVESGGAKALAGDPSIPAGDYLIITRDSDREEVTELPSGSRMAGFIALEVLSGRWLTVDALHLRITRPEGVAEEGDGDDTPR
jgi:hypothetical protein